MRAYFFTTMRACHVAASPHTHVGFSFPPSPLVAARAIARPHPFFFPSVSEFYICLLPSSAFSLHASCLLLSTHSTARAAAAAAVPQDHHRTTTTTTALPPLLLLLLQRCSISCHPLLNSGLSSHTHIAQLVYVCVRIPGSTTSSSAYDHHQHHH